MKIFVLMCILGAAVTDIPDASAVTDLEKGRVVAPVASEVAETRPVR